MRHGLRAAVILLVSVCASAQDGTLPLPSNVTAEGVPPIPVAIADAVSAYGDYRQARFLVWHPVEPRMLIETAFGSVPQVHEVRAPGAARTQLTFHRDGVTRDDLSRSSAWYAPDGRTIVFRKDVGGGTEAFQLFRLDVATGSVTLLTDGRARTGVPVWSRQGLIAYDSTRRDGKNRDIYVMDPSRPDSDRLVVQNDGSWQVLDWSPDGTELLAQALISGSSEAYLWRVDVASGRKTALTTRGSAPVLWSAAAYTPDGASVMAVSNQDSEWPRLWRATLEDGRWTPISAPNDDVNAFAISPDGTRAALVVDRGATTRLLLVDARTGKSVASPEVPPGVITNPAWHPKTGILAFTYAGARTFSDVYALDPRTGTIERWTTSEIGGANPENLPDAELIEWTSFDGLKVSGILYRPAPRFTGPRPVMINVHGGPAARERPRALGLSNYFRNELGMALIYPNIRGSSGFGRTYETLDNGRLRENAVKDIGALLDMIDADPGLDERRVMITGASYGGYVTLASAIAYGDRLRCAFAGFAISDFVSFLESTDVSRQRDRNVEYGDPADPVMREFLTSISPLTHASKLKIPLFLAQGGKDTRVPLAQAETMAQAVRQNGAPLWFVVYTDAGHLQLNRTTNAFNTAAWVMFVKQFLLD